jgi:2,3-bisphosphoglycerate-independent phosphoglycerate mutase
MCLYDETFGLPVAYPKQRLSRLLVDILSEHGLRQFRLAETEKYAHVTFFFNGGVETPYPGESRLLIPSPRVATYDLQPEMSLRQVTDALVTAIEGGQYEVIICNFANPDMVGHTGKLAATISAVEAVDVCLKRVLDAITATGGSWLLTADHGNCETMVDTDGGEHTAHTTEPVPLVLVSSQADIGLRAPEAGVASLSCMAPTMLDLLGLPIPAEMTSPSLLVRQTAPLATAPTPA